MEGFKQCMDSLLLSGIIFDTFITGRHSAIAKYMRENLAHIKHYFDLWHLKELSIVIHVFNIKCDWLVNHENEVSRLYNIVFDPGYIIDREVVCIISIEYILPRNSQSAN